MKTNNVGGLNLPSVLFVIFLVLKLTNTIDWSWWWVTSPLWIPLALAVVLGVVVGVGLTLFPKLLNLTTLKSLKDKLNG
jgi:uncharacterized integral membrane protein